MLIDTHIHIMPKYRLRGLARWMNKAFPTFGVSETTTPDDLVNELQEGGITHFFNLIYPLREDETVKLNQFNADFCKKTPGAVPFASIHQDSPDKARLAEKTLKENDFVGFKLHPFVQNFDPWDRRMDPFYAFLQEAGKPVLFHTGFEDFYQKEMPVQKLREILQKYPKLPVVFVHMAFPNIEEVFAMMDEFPELYLDATGVFFFLRRGVEPYIPSHLADGRLAEILTKGLEKNRGRVMFGSDHPVGLGDVTKIFRDLTFLSVSEDTVQSLKYGAAVSFVDRFMPGFDWSKSLLSRISSREF